jgi:cell division protein ZapA (FtsZ GTPase activity inhibitor)
MANPEDHSLNGQPGPERTLNEVTVSIMGHPYRIRSDRPDMVRYLGDMVEAQIETVRQKASAQSQDIDLLIQAAFALAFKTYTAQNELKALSQSFSQAQSKAESLLSSLDPFLPESPETKEDGLMEASSNPDGPSPPPLQGGGSETEDPS